ncbi:MAG: M48 family metallopeptidase [Gammaproteobacteria bacterium]|nr:M48 family metallopeptidase [Gammaproteobacteria bacterium]NNF50424.1 M48 family metallopeptidase [Woeseiaceae bacterium]MBT8094427.1 M48 family metallopeptidase [Gammaproteobacteria bacterium]MBT8105254.1 M48 family metallopeptidase [Gammaproteobacteria bacterium]NNK25268.1 M48 family metallopeptidase [Woeseiaceae bacterium]
MNFFDAQDRARQASRRLVFAYGLATVFIVLGVTAIVAFALYSFTDLGYGYTVGQFIANNSGTLVAAAVLTALFIFGASLFKTAALSSGGGAVARQLGGTLVPADVQDPLRRRLRNVVEEMAIASGVPVPEIYVLEEESGINAFAAGYSPSDAAVAVTRGTLELLERDELQGVIAHEFSHILNGDMRLNIRLMGVLFGIMVLALIGRLIVRGGHHASIVSSRRDRSAPVVLIIGLGLVILGWIGMFFARVIKAGVSRQREYLADASAVQFTRQSRGIANALKKIGGYSHGSKIEAADPEEVSHMLFGSGSKLSGMFATHPPLVERIQALDPNFAAGDFPQVERPRFRGDDRDRPAGVSDFAPDVTTALAAGGAQALAESIAETVGQPENEHVKYAQHLRQSIPDSLYDAAHSAELAYLLTIALILDRSGRIVDRQLALARDQLGSERAGVVRRFYDELGGTDAEYRLPLLAVAFPALKLRPTPELSYLVSLATRMIEIDGQIDLYEFCFYRILMSNLGKAVDPAGRRRAKRASKTAIRESAIELLRILADYGHEDELVARAAYDTGLATLGNWASGFEFRSDRRNTVASLDHALDVLLGLNSKGKESLLRAISATAGHDGHLSVTEAELIRAVCATLDYPLPPILVHEGHS